MFGKILTYAFILLIISDVYIYSVFIRKLTKNIVLRLLWFIPSIFLLIGLYFFFYSGMKSNYRDIYMLTYLGIVLPKAFFFIISLLDLPLRLFFKKWKIYPFTIVGFITAIAALYIIVYGSIWGKTDFDVKNITFTSSRLPDSFNDYRVVQVSDLHIGNWKGNKAPIKELVDIINEQKADVVMVTGDLVNHAAKELVGYESILSSIKSKDGVYSVLGNHDYGAYRHWENKQKEAQNLADLKTKQQNFGWKLLNNVHLHIIKNKDSIAIIGVENSGRPPFSDHGDLPKAMKGIDKNTFKILLSHDPTHWRREVLNTDIDLMLAGHTHATQFKLGPFSFASLAYPEWGGLYQSGSQGLYVNVGIGYVAVPFRFGAWPEITVITLKNK